TPAGCPAIGVSWRGRGDRHDAREGRRSRPAASFGAAGAGWLDQIDQSAIRSQVHAWTGAGTTPEDRHRWSGRRALLHELAAQRVLDESPERVAPPSR